MKLVEISAQEIRIDPHPEEIARQQRLQLVTALRDKATPTLADIRNLLIAIWEELEAIRKHAQAQAEQASAGDQR